MASSSIGSDPARDIPTTTAGTGGMPCEITAPVTTLRLLLTNGGGQLPWLEQVRLRQQRRLAQRRNSLRDELFRLETEEWNDERNQHENRVLYDRNRAEILDLDHVARRMRIGHIRKILGLAPMTYDRYWCYAADGSRNMSNRPVQQAHEDLPGEPAAFDEGVEGDGSGGVGPTPNAPTPAADVPGDVPPRRAWGAPKDSPDDPRSVTPPDGPGLKRP